MKKNLSWGRYPQVQPRATLPILWQSDLPHLTGYPTSVLPRGFGRSYGDSCLNEDGMLLDTTPLMRLIHFDAQQGIIRCEAGVSFADLLQFIVPRGWFLPVTPGTKFISVAGAIANDIHGKNHHKAGTFGAHVIQFELLRSNGEQLICSATQNTELYRATIGGLGLTGLILWAEFKLKPIHNACIAMERIRFANLEEFFALANQSDRDYEYTVAWVDCLSAGPQQGRGIFFRGNHAHEGFSKSSNHSFRVPCDLPDFLLNRFTMKIMNGLIYSSAPPDEQKIVHYDPFFYPLDAIHDWNRCYGKRGFLQYQCVIPYGQHEETTQKILSRVARSGTASFLSVLKLFGDQPSPGLLSFPKPGVTLAMDFAFRGTKTLQLLEDLDSMVCEMGGLVYPAKDARMSAEHFQNFFPQWREFARFIDPKFSSSFWRRVTQDSTRSSS